MIQLNHESNKRSFKNIPNILLSKIPSSNEFISQYNSAQFSPIKIFFLELVGINENHIETHQINESIEVPLHQAQNIGSRESLLSSETIIEGNWFDSTNGILECSIENQFANKLNLKIEINSPLWFMDIQRRQSLQTYDLSIGMHLNPIHRS